MRFLHVDQNRCLCALDSDNALCSACQCFAELIDVIDATLENQANEDTIEDALEKEVFEVIDRREETVKHFRTEDGSFAAVQ